MTSRAEDLDRFYRLLSELENRRGGKRQLSQCSGQMTWPKRGVYFFFEQGQVRNDGVTPRVVRVGTHALKRSKSTLWGRLAQHKGSTAGTMPGGGNHRGSIFRLHVGNALLSAGSWAPEIDISWGVGSSATAAVRLEEYPLELAVSEHIGAMSFLWLTVDDPPSATSDRGIIESGSIALLSNFGGSSTDLPTPAWLGHHSDRPTITGSGLWNVNHVHEIYDPAFLDVLAHHVQEDQAV
jgi:hypothetical protein